jgi:ATP-binding cassette subfamily F protein 3
MGKSPLIGWMPQTVDELDLPDNANVRDFLRSGRPLPEIERELAEVYASMANGDNSEKILDKLGKLQSDYEHWDGYSAEAELDAMIAQMNVDPENLDKNIGEISGGQKSKISFIRSLYSRPNILLLDEPTNHLDAASRDWMIDYLGSMDANVIFISHDEDFIKKTARKILYIDALAHTATLYNSGYDRFLRTLAETNAGLEKQLQNQMREINRIQHFVDSMKGKYGKRKRQAQSREKALEKMKKNLAAPQQKKREIDIELKPSREGDANPITAENLYFSYASGKNVIKNLTFSLNRGEKFIVVGENGAGKSTLLKLIYGVLHQQSGNLKIGSKTDLGYYAQEYETLKNNANVLENVSKSSNLSVTKIRALLGKFNFHEDKMKQSAATLSPGERSRLELARLCMSGANTLLMDEPTNHLDVSTRKSMAESFREYGGTLVIVSHDVEFLKALGVERMLMLPSGRVKFFDENIVRKYMELENRKSNADAGAKPNRILSRP